MTIDPTTLPACTEEDGSTPGQVLPCYWDATVQGNGQGTSYVLTEAGGSDHMVTPEPVAQPVAEQPAPAAALTLTPAAAPAELAHTGVDPIAGLVAVLLVSVGAALVALSRRVAA